MDKDALCGEIKRNGLKHSEVAERIGMSPKTFSQKLNKNKFGIDDAEKMIKLLGIKKPAAIFFSNGVT
jgi:transcriptional regulator with XRE-family HTH domain